MKGTHMLLTDMTITTKTLNKDGIVHWWEKGNKFGHYFFSIKCFRIIFNPTHVLL